MGAELVSITKQEASRIWKGYPDTAKVVKEMLETGVAGREAGQALPGVLPLPLSFGRTSAWVGFMNLLPFLREGLITTAAKVRVAPPIVTLIRPEMVVAEPLEKTDDPAASPD